MLAMKDMLDPIQEKLYIMSPLYIMSSKQGVSGK